MKKLIVLGAMCLAVPSAALAADPPAKPMECCCEKMKKEGKDCCPKKDEAQHETHGDHTMETPKS